MKRNRKISKKMSVAANCSAKAGAVMLAAFVMVILNLLANSSCGQLMKSIGEKERVLSGLEDELRRESARWDAMKTTEKLESALLKHGLSMKYPRPEQVVRMKADGRPYPGQLSVARVEKKSNGAYRVAKNKRK